VTSARRKSAELGSDEFQDTETADAFDRLLNDPTEVEILEDSLGTDSRDRDSVELRVTSDPVRSGGTPQSVSSVPFPSPDIQSYQCESQPELAEVEVFPFTFAAPPPRDRSTTSPPIFCHQTLSSSSVSPKVITQHTSSPAVDQYLQEPSVEEVDRLLMEAAESAKKRRQSEVQPTTHSHLGNLRDSQPSYSYIPSREVHSPRFGQEPPFCPPSQTSVSVSNESNQEMSLEDLDRMFLEATESSKRKRESQGCIVTTSTSYLPLQHSHHSPTSLPPPTSVSAHEEPSPTSQEPSLEEVDRMMFEAEETLKKKRQSQASDLVQCSSSIYSTSQSHSCGTQPSNRKYPPSQPLHPPSYGFPPLSPISQESTTVDDKRGGRIPISTNSLPPSRSLNSPYPYQRRSTGGGVASSTVSNNPSKYVPVSSRPPSAGVRTVAAVDSPNPYAKFMANTNSSQKPTTPKLSISYDTISMEELSALEEMEQYALSQRNLEVCFPLPSLSLNELHSLRIHNPGVTFAILKPLQGKVDPPSSPQSLINFMSQRSRLFPPVTIFVDDLLFSK
jgi:hypothetical protein